MTCDLCLQSQLAKVEADLERSEIQLEQTVSELRSAKISQNEAGQLKDVYRKKCEAYLRQRKDIEEQINEGQFLVMVFGLIFGLASLQTSKYIQSLFQIFIFLGIFPGHVYRCDLKSCKLSIKVVRTVNNETITKLRSSEGCNDSIQH